MEQDKPSTASDSDIDGLNDDTFGSGAVEDDWEKSHFALVEDEGGYPMSREGLHHDDVMHDDAIVKAMSGAANGHTPRPPAEELDSSFANMKLKELWPSSPQQVQGSIWSSPEVPHSVEKAPAHPVPSGKVISVEELERELTSSPPHSSPHPPPHPSHTSPHPPHSRSPPPPHLMYMPRPPPHARMPIPVHEGVGQVLPFPWTTSSSLSGSTTWACGRRGQGDRPPLAVPSAPRRWRGSPLCSDWSRA